MILGKVIRDFRQPKTFVDVYIQTLKKDKDDFKVIDVGGGINSWCQHTTDVVDIFVNPGSKEEFNNLHPGRNLFNFDITQKENWHEVLKYVEENGKFDFSICTHTLEDIPNPALVCDMLQKISHKGFISVPSKYAEYLRFESWYGVQGYRGFFHHKWIYSIKNDVFTGFEKASYWEHLRDDRLNKEIGFMTEIGFIWDTDFSYKFYDSGEVIGCNTEPKFSFIFEIDDLSI